MKRKFILTLALLVVTNCASRSVSQTDKIANASLSTPQIVTSETPASEEKTNEVSGESEKNRDVPSEFRNIDFKNFSYPISLNKQTIRLTEGKYEYYHDKKLDEYGGGWFYFDDVNYFDVTGDGNKDALVRVTWIACGGSCDGGSTLIYVYSIRDKKLSLIWRIETGSLAEECGLKSLTVNERIIDLEVFRICRIKGATLEVKYNPLEHYKFDARGFTRFLFKFNGKTFTLSKREAFTNYQEDVKNYQPTINISDD